MTKVSVSIASAVQQQSMTTREIAQSVHDGAVHTAQASAEINSVKQTVNRGVAAVGEITNWTACLSARAQRSGSEGGDLLQPRSRGVTVTPIGSSFRKRPNSKTETAGTRPGHDVARDRERGALYSAGCFGFNSPNERLRLSHSSILAPFLCMIALCWITESVLFHAQ